MMIVEKQILEEGSNKRRSMKHSRRNNSPCEKKETDILLTSKSVY